MVVVYLTNGERVEVRDARRAVRVQADRWSPRDADELQCLDRTGTIIARLPLRDVLGYSVR